MNQAGELPTYKKKMSLDRATTNNNNTTTQKETEKKTWAGWIGTSTCAELKLKEKK
jgi:hypothetical protein